MLSDFTPPKNNLQRIIKLTELFSQQHKHVTLLKTPLFLAMQ